MSTNNTPINNTSVTDTPKKKEWPANCPWPNVHTNDCFWEAEDAAFMSLDEDGLDLLEIKDYMDELVQCGRLNEDYTLNEEYEAWEGAEDTEDFEEDDDNEDASEFIPKMGTDYWDDGFIVDAWEEDLITHINLLKLPLPSPAEEISRVIDYEFINENLLRQAFTRRAFGLEYKTGDGEMLEFLGDSVLNTVVTWEITRQLTDVCDVSPEGPFISSFSEGDLTKIRQHYVCREYLSERAAALGLDRFILYGTGEEPGEAAREDMMEALIGAVAVDCGWDSAVLENVVDHLLCIQLMKPDSLLKATHYDLFNAWHQRRTGRMPDYEIHKYKQWYHCTLRFFTPEGDRLVARRVDEDGETRSQARERSAEQAYRYVVNNGFWMDLKDAAVVPELENAINQLQELYQKKYLEEKPIYEFEERDYGEWYCSCNCGGLHGWGRAKGKTPAKKRAAFMLLVRLMKSSGICKPEWEKAMWGMI